jgi:hypothetical protein
MTSNNDADPAPVHRLVGQLRELMCKAGEYPRLEPVGSNWKYYACPLCGEGSIEDERVSEGVVTHGVGLDISIVGIQAFGFGDGVAAMEKLIPLALHHLPALLAIAEAAAEVVAIDATPDGSVDANGVAIDRLSHALSLLPNSVLGSAQPPSPGLGGTQPPGADGARPT